MGKRLSILKLLWCIVFTVEANVELSLLEHLFKNYSKCVRPVQNHEMAINITFDMSFRQLMYMDERGEKISIQAAYHVSWTDEKLTWDANEWKNLTEIIVSREKVWSPDLTLLSNARRDAPKPHSGTDYVVILQDGLSHWHPIVTLTAEYKVNIRYFPFDMQTCTFRFASWILDVRKLNILNITKEPLLAKYYVKSAEWTVVKTEKKIVHPLLEGEDRSTQVHFSYSFLRKSLYYVITLIVPCLVLICIILFSYYLPPTSGERMGVVITVLLAFAVFLEVVRSSLPQNADSTSVLAIFYLVSMILSTLSLLATCLIISMLHRTSETLPPLVIRQYVTRTLDIYSECGYSFSDIEGGERYIAKVVQKKHVGNSRKKHYPLAKNSTGSSELATIISHLKIITENQEEHLRIVKSEIEKKIAVKSKLEYVKREWRLLADILDRVCFWVFLALFIIISLAILVPAYIKY